ncbi:unnamed protein product [Rhodiola kirilowii]
MARSFAKVNVVATLIAKQASAATNRGFAVLYQAVKCSRKKVMTLKPAEMEPAASAMDSRCENWVLQAREPRMRRMRWRKLKTAQSTRKAVRRSLSSATQFQTTPMTR